MRTDLVKGRTWLQSLNTTAKCGTILLCHISPFRISHLPNPPPPPPVMCNTTDAHFRDLLVDRGHCGRGVEWTGELRDPPTQTLGNPRDPELSHPHKGGGGGGAGLLDSQPATKAV